MQVQLVNEKSVMNKASVIINDAHRAPQEMMSV